MTCKTITKRCKSNSSKYVDVMTAFVTGHNCCLAYKGCVAEHAMCQTTQVCCCLTASANSSFWQVRAVSIPAVAFCAAVLPTVGSSSIELGRMTAWEGPGGVVLVPVVVAACAGESWVERAEAGGALVLTGSSDVVRSLPVSPYSRSTQIRRLLALLPFWLARLVVLT